MFFLLCKKIVKFELFCKNNKKNEIKLKNMVNNVKGFTNDNFRYIYFYL